MSFNLSNSFFARFGLALVLGLSSAGVFAQVAPLPLAAPNPDLLVHLVYQTGDLKSQISVLRGSRFVPRPVSIPVPPFYQRRGLPPVLNRSTDLAAVNPAAREFLFNVLAFARGPFNSRQDNDVYSVGSMVHYLNIDAGELLEAWNNMYLSYGNPNEVAAFMYQFRRTEIMYANTINALNYLITALHMTYLAANPTFQVIPPLAPRNELLRVMLSKLEQMTFQLRELMYLIRVQMWMVPQMVGGRPMPPVAFYLPQTSAVPWEVRYQSTRIDVSAGSIDYQPFPSFPYVGTQGQGGAVGVQGSYRGQAFGAQGAGAGQFSSDPNAYAPSASIPQGFQMPNAPGNYQNQYDMQGWKELIEQKNRLLQNPQANQVTPQVPAPGQSGQFLGAPQPPPGAGQQGVPQPQGPAQLIQPPAPPAAVNPQSFQPGAQPAEEFQYRMPPGQASPQGR